MPDARNKTSRYLHDLPGHIYVDDLDGGLWKIDRNANLMDVRFSLHEATVVHLRESLNECGTAGLIEDGFVSCLDWFNLGD